MSNLILKGKCTEAKDHASYPLVSSLLDPCFSVVTSLIEIFLSDSRHELRSLHPALLTCHHAVLLSLTSATLLVPNQSLKCEHSLHHHTEAIVLAALRKFSDLISAELRSDEIDECDY